MNELNAIEATWRKFTFASLLTSLLSVTASIATLL